ncbi:hypothetical protein CCH79_00005173 [Gambusia affinis]|uniref:Glutathione peroxidase n=1 Tax=Gambusia affinis TaxID=33528 RepID=A0A315VP86_GAMAF|nr:hypothetical protein CCH79_00005173 [Gambusia affinis]
MKRSSLPLQALRASVVCWKIFLVVFMKSHSSSINLPFTDMPLTLIFCQSASFCSEQAENAFSPQTVLPGVKHGGGSVMPLGLSLYVKQTTSKESERQPEWVLGRLVSVFDGASVQLRRRYYAENNQLLCLRDRLETQQAGNWEQKLLEGRLSDTGKKSSSRGLVPRLAATQKQSLGACCGGVGGSVTHIWRPWVLDAAVAGSIPGPGDKICWFDPVVCCDNMGGAKRIINGRRQGGHVIRAASMWLRPTVLLGVVGSRVLVRAMVDNWKTAKSIYEFSAKDIDGNEVSLEKYKGHVCIIVNVASK